MKSQYNTKRNKSQAPYRKYTENVVASALMHPDCRVYAERPGLAGRGPRNLNRTGCPITERINFLVSFVYLNIGIFL